MKILHYSLGFPPYRRGGMTKYCLDLMVEQSKQGHQVAMLWPGMIVSYSKKSAILAKKKQKIGTQKFSNYELINPLPIALLSGINDIAVYTQEKEEVYFVRFFEKKRFDILHIHTLMGLPIELIHAAKKSGCKIVYTTHDYFGICPKTSLVIGNRPCDCASNYAMCGECNKNALPLNKIQIVQSPIYRLLKNSRLVKKMRKNQLNQQMADFTRLDELSVREQDNSRECTDKYRKLQSYYYACFDQVDFVHFNSSITDRIFKDHGVPIHESKIISISHSGVVDCKQRKQAGETIRIGYLGGYSVRKGCAMLIEALDSLYMQGYRNFSLSVFAKYPEKKKYLIENEPYSYDELPIILDSLDLIVLPSIWFETFGFTVLEALSRGVPVLVSSHAGSKDIVQHERYGMIFKPEKDELVKCLKLVLDDPKLIESYNNSIIEHCSIETMEKHNISIMNEYNRIISNQHKSYC